MHKSKKKSSKTAKIPKPIKVKKEKSEEDRTPQPMSHYVDDRLELIKQVFGTLKPKTITNLAPEFLKKKELEEIQEACLNELLGISKKRLISIIEATKCPSDTETSSDSDVNNVEEHVSLEEISSDSEIEGGGAKTSKKKSSANGGGTKKNGVKNSAEKDENTGQISVLELLELQARARAIRSQLALEPVTKIEVTSDNDSDGISSTRSKESRSSSRKERKRKSEEGVKTSKKKNKINGEHTPSSTSDKTLKVIRPPTEPAQKIKLKRNFRTNNENPPVAVEDEKKTEADVRANAITGSNVVKEEKSSRSASPDVIPIVAEPETLMISDSSDEDEGDVRKAKTAVAAASVTVQQTCKTPEVTIVPTSIKEAIVQAEKSNIVKEPEEGEILDETDSSQNAAENIQKNTNSSSAEENVGERDNNTTKNNIEPQTRPLQTHSTAEKPVVSNAMHSKEESSEDSKPIMQHVADVSQSSAVTSTAPLPASTTKPAIEGDDDDDDQNDDVISIEGGDLETEMTEHLEKDNSNADSSQSSTTACNKIKEEEDIISLNSSDDEIGTKDSTESWSSRWLKSSKVSKVLATSRLGARVRDKIKKTKRTKKEMIREAAEAAAAAEANKNNSSSYASKHEDGSIEQYKELLELRQQRKN